MKTYKLGTVIASRELSFAEGGTVVVRIGKPQYEKARSWYFCPYQMIGIGNDAVRRAAGGIDSIHAVQLVLEKIGIDLFTLNASYQGALRWEGGEEGDLGFPLREEITKILTSES
jgi:hypothetical protein